MEVNRYIVSYIVYIYIYKPNSSEADYINNHILIVFKYIFNIQLILKPYSEFLNEQTTINVTTAVFKFTE
jgi:hypothetical protein